MSRKFEISIIPDTEHDVAAIEAKVMNEWQKCPVCEGTGYVAYPYGIAAGQTWGSTDCSNKQCHRCAGSGTIVKPTSVEKGLETRIHVLVERTKRGNYLPGTET